MAKLVIFQNYFTPYRWKLFQEIGLRMSLTVIYLHTPQDEGRKWTEKDFAKDQSFTSIQLESGKVGPFVTSKIDKKVLAEHIEKESTVIFLDNLPTNFTMLRILYTTRNLVSYQKRVLWVEHQWVKETDKSRIPFYNQLKFLYKIAWSWLLAFNCNKLLSFSNASTEYLKKLGLPMGTQKLYRTVQATYTTNEIQSYLVHSRQNDSIDITFGFLGYFSPRKGIKNFLTAIKFFTNSHAKFLFIGDGPEKALIEKAAKSDNRIMLHPYVKTEDEKSKVLNNIDVLVVPSEKDPWGLVVNEAASRKAPSIVSPNVGAKEMMQKVSPELIMGDNEPLSIAKAMNNLTAMKRNKAKWEKLIKATANQATEWSIEKAADGIIAATN